MILAKLLGEVIAPIQVDFTQFNLPNKPNYYFCCPEGFSNITPQKLSPIYPVSLDELDSAWQEMIKRQPHIACLASDLARYKFTYQQKTKYLRFPDTINVELLPLSENTSSIAIYSQSRYGYSDLKTNQKRVYHWLEELCQNLPNAK